MTQQEIINKHCPTHCPSDNQIKICMDKWAEGFAEWAVNNSDWEYNWDGIWRDQSLPMTGVFGC